MKTYLIISITISTLAIAGLAYLFIPREASLPEVEIPVISETQKESTRELLSEIPNNKKITGLSHVWQTFNNCSSVALVIALSHFGITDTQEAVAEATRPWNNRSGDNDDKAVTLYELADYAKAEHGVAVYMRPNGDIELLKKFVANDIPVLTRALMYPDKDFQHYRVVFGYDDQAIYESDGIEGKNQRYTYGEWLHMWKDFNYSYLIVVPESKRALVEQILAEEKDEKVAWQNAKARAEVELAKNSSDMRAHYNLVTALYYLGDYEGTVREFEKIESRLTRHVVRYQAEPIEAYFKLKNYDRVIELADKVINDDNKAMSELYVMKGQIYESRGDKISAKAEYEKAIYYNKHLKSAQEALAKLL